MIQSKVIPIIKDNWEAAPFYNMAWIVPLELMKGIYLSSLDYSYTPIQPIHLTSIGGPDQISSADTWLSQRPALLRANGRRYSKVTMNNPICRGYYSYFTI